MARLVIGSGEEARMHELSGTTITIGRAPENTIQIEEASVSGRHAQLLGDGDQVRLVDLDSTNGTRVNGEPVKEMILRAGNVLCFGKVEARFEAEEKTTPEITVTREPIAAPVAPVETTVPLSPRATASTFSPRRRSQDNLARLSYAAASVAFLAFLFAMVAVAMLRPPG